jgi:peptidoglycan/LPS O-acetylase OafA/YrhL
VSAHFPALDGLRGVAILLVLAHHLTVVRPATEFDTIVLALLHTGWAGVDLFFVLSGFLITGILIDSHGSRRYFSSFYARRTLRIFPLYYLIVFLSYHVLPHFPTWFARLAGLGPIPPERDYWLYLSNFGVAERNGLRHGILDISWSLAVEEQFYIVWAVVVWLCRPNWLGWLCALIVVGTPLLRSAAIAAGALEYEIYVLPQYRADSLAAGAGLAWLARRPTWSTMRVLGPWAILVGLAGTAGLVWWDGHNVWTGGAKQVVGYSCLALASSGLLVCAITESKRGLWVRALSTSWLRMFGRYSYCLYLIHLPVMWSVRYEVYDPTRAPTVFGSSLPAQLAFWPLAIAPALGIAWLSWRYFEEPLQRVKRFFPY